MLVKEPGYDEFVAEQIAAGKADSAAGRVLSLEESRKRTFASIEQKAKKLEETEREMVAYG